MHISWGLVGTGQGLEREACHIELEHRVENLKHMTLVGSHAARDQEQI